VSAPLARRLLLIALGLALTGAAVWTLWPKPVLVDVASVTRGLLEVTVDEEGRTRVRDIYVVSSPITGRVLRAPVHVGDAVVENQTVVALLQRLDPSLLDLRARRELEAGVEAARAATRLAEAEVRRAEASLEFARSDFARVSTLARSGTVSSQALDRARMQVDTSEAALASARAALEVRLRELGSASARLIEPGSGADEAAPSTCCVEVKSPAAGEVLKLVQESERVVLNGTPLVEVGDPRALEIVVELLSTDAVRVEAGAPVHIDGWGGDPLHGRVQRVESAGFTKVSALGVEEQRVRVIVDFTDPPNRWQRLGHDYRVVARITVWRADDVMIVPLGALFRQGGDWAVYVLERGRAALRRVSIGQRNNRFAQILEGLNEGETVVLHPGEAVAEHVRLAIRERS
jgi:HlyD family secretion protein